MNRKTLLLMTLVAMLVLSVVPTLAQEPVEIEFWIAFTDYRQEWTEAQAAEFNELFPQYNVVVTGVGSYNDVYDQTVLAVEGGSQPALIHFFEAATQQARDSVKPDGTPLFKSVAEAIGDRTEVNGVPVLVDDVVSAAADYYTTGDGVFESMAWNTSTTIMFSNMSILEAAGIMDIPETWGGIVEACEAIMALDDGPDNCITWPNHSWFMEQSIAQQGADLVNNGNGREARADEVFFNSDAMLAYVNWWKDLNDAGYYIHTGKVRDWDGTQNAFVAEQVAFLIFSSSDSTKIPDLTEFEAVVSRMPYNEEAGYHGNIIGGGTIWLTNGLDPEVEEGAVTFLNWFINPDTAASWHQTTGYIPITNTAFNNLTEDGWFDENPNAAVANMQLDLIPTTGPLIGDFTTIRDIFTDAMDAILLEGADVEETMNDANDKANEVLEEYLLLFGD